MIESSTKDRRNYLQYAPAVAKKTQSLSLKTASDVEPKAKT
jgi:hypothetical protein